MLTSLLDKLQARYPANVVRNQKYNFATFLPLVFYEQFKFFFNLYFLLVALSQFVPALKIGACNSISHVNRVLNYNNPSRFYCHVRGTVGIRSNGHYGERGL